MTKQILAPTFLFRISARCHQADPLWSGSSVNVNAEHLLPAFGELAGAPTFAQVFVGWNATGLAMKVIVSGKKQAIWCRSAKMDDSDGLSVWVDTRDTHDVHRANRFCSRYLFMPSGGGSRFDQPFATMLKISRAKEESKNLNRGRLGVSGLIRADGYELHAFMPEESMFGFDPKEHKRLGFCFAIMDRELGAQTFSVGLDFPIDSDPSLWGTLELVD
jgi:hypothetical protein